MTTWLAEVSVTLHDEDAETQRIVLFGAESDFGFTNSPEGQVSVRVTHDDTKEAFALALEMAAAVARASAPSTQAAATRTQEAPGRDRT